MADAAITRAQLREVITQAKPPAADLKPLLSWVDTAKEFTVGAYTNCPVTQVFGKIGTSGIDARRHSFAIRFDGAVSDATGWKAIWPTIEITD
jgi:hypothetical protein